jgi:hypothetical protein
VKGHVTIAHEKEGYRDNSVTVKNIVPLSPYFFGQGILLLLLLLLLSAP